MRNVKQADLQTSLGLDDNQTNYAKWLGKFLLGAGALGAGVRGATGLADMVGMNMKKRPQAPEPVMINIPYRRPKEESMSGIGDIKQADATDWLRDSWFFKGAPGAASAADIPAAWPATVLGGVGALYGGHKLMDQFVNNRKQKMMDDDLEDARSDYESALLQQFKPVPHTKVRQVSLKEPIATKVGSQLTEEVAKALIEKKAEGSLTTLADKLDQLAEQACSTMEKRAVLGYDIGWPWEWNAQGTPGKAVTGAGGLYGIIAPTLAGASGLAMYNYAKGNDPEAAVADALRKQHQERWAKRPPDVFARLVGVDERGRPLKTPPSMPPQPSPEKTAELDDVNIKAAAFVRDLLGG